MVTVIRYSSRYKPEWDAFVRTSKNGTFMLLRDYMEYHADRYADHSLLFYYKDKLIAVLPANADGTDLYAHAGLSYGGMISGHQMKAALMLQVFEALVRYSREQGFSTLYYKAIPHIYHQTPAEEDLYALFRYGATLYRRDVNSVIDLTDEKPHYSQLRKRKLRKAEKLGLTVQISSDYATYLQLITQLLEEKYQLKPAHTTAELIRLSSCFPEHIKLYAVHEHDDMIAGIVVYESGRVAHCQYIGASVRGQEIAALDFLLDHLITQVYPHKRYFSFGVSTERQGLYLNEGLVSYKESYGAHTVVHDFYQLDF